MKSLTKNYCKDEQSLESVNDCCCSKRKTQRGYDEYKNLTNRLCRIEGQIKGIKRMLENNCYCPDILIQVSAVNSALNSFNKVLLASHLRTCVIDDIKNDKEGIIDELVATLQKLMK
ncbi:metal-sensing transcriptional repressor [Treponema pectinovorum]|uniref:metal-sensing transcriptional repressor n=1 Tax=Treponema pectinovorum TaxID=164 RepID=UPI0011C99C6C|nr:metal-sensing transcriptional repressor [Treponema pectinovorum]